jgi:hypothetical protein
MCLSLDREMENQIKSIAFSISGGCYFYQLGIAYYLQSSFDLTNLSLQFSGSSGGTWPALLLASNYNIKKAFEILIKYAPECTLNRPIFGAYMVYDQGIKIVFQKLWNHIDLVSQINGKLALSVTRLIWEKNNRYIPYFKDEIITKFYSNQDILECIIASALIPYALNGKPYVIYRGWICADGGITNVTGVRHFAEELVHDIELIEEELVEKAHHLTDEFVHTIRDEIFYCDSNQSHSKHLPMTTGPEDIIQFGATIAMTVIDVVTESLDRLLQARQAQEIQTITSLSDPTHLHYFEPEESEENAQSKSVPLSFLSPLNILNSLHHISSSLHQKYDTKTNSSDSGENEGSITNPRPPSSLISILSSTLSLASSERLFSDASVSIEEIYANESYWIGNHFSSHGVDPNYTSHYVVNRHEEESIHPSSTPHDSFDHPSLAENSPFKFEELSLQSADAAPPDVRHLTFTDSRVCEEDVISLSTIVDSDTLVIINKPDDPCSTKEFSSSENGSDCFPNVGSVDSSIHLSPIHITHSEKVPQGQSTQRPSASNQDSSMARPKPTDFWKNKGKIIKQIPNQGGIQLEISPWMWRHHPVWNYHLSSDPKHAIELFNMGINDAHHHHDELKQFFDC